MGGGNVLILNNLKLYVIWLLGQSSIVQFWTPDFLKFFGEGIPNAPLWTICVELQFYLFVPILFFIVRKLPLYKFHIFLILFILSGIFNYWLSLFPKETLMYKIGFVTLFQYLFYFMFGIVFYNYWHRIQKFVEGKFILFFSIFLLTYFLLKNHFDTDLNNYHLTSVVKLIFIILLNLTILSFSFSFKGLSERLIGKQDISYGIYIYHMLIINIFIEIGIPHQTLLSFIIILLITILMAMLSWFYIEKPMLKRK